MCLIILNILAACNQQHINGRQIIPETTLKETTIEEVYPSESSNRISVNSGDNEVTVYIDELSVRVKYGSFDTTYVIHERYYGERFPQVNFEFSSESDVVVTQSEKVSNLNIGITGSNVTFKGPNPITAFRADSLNPSYPDDIEIHFEVSAPNLRLKPSSNVKYYLEVQSLEFESIDLENGKTVQLITYEKTNLKLKSIEYKSMYDDKNGFPEQPNIIVDVGFIHFYESPRTLVFDFPIVIHEYIKSYYRSLFRFKDLKIADDSFYIVLMPQTQSQQAVYLNTLFIENGDKIELPPSGVINIFLKAGFYDFSNSNKLEFANSMNSVNFNLTYMDYLKCLGPIVVKSGNTYYIQVNEIPFTEVLLVYGESPYPEEEFEAIKINTLDSRKWPKDLFDLCTVTSLGIVITKKPTEPLNLEIIIGIENKIKMELMLFNVDIKLDFTESMIAHMRILYINGASHITDARRVNFGSNIELSVMNEIVIDDKALDKMIRDDIIACEISYSGFLSMKEKILKGREVRISFEEIKNDIKVDYGTDSVKIILNGQSNVISTVGKQIILDLIQYSSGGSSSIVTITSSSKTPTNNCVIKCQNANFEGDIPDNLFPLISAEKITCSVILPLVNSHNYGIIEVFTQVSKIDVTIKNDLEAGSDYTFRYYYNFPSNVKKINLQSKISIPYIDYKMISENEDLNSAIDELKITGISFDIILKDDAYVYQEYLNSLITTEEYRRKISKESKFPQITPTKLIICSGSYVSMIDGDNKPSSIDFVFRPTSFPPVLDSNINFSDVSFKFSYQNQDDATYDKYDFFFNKFVPIAFLRESLCSDLDLSITNTDKMTVKCEDTFSGVTDDKKHAVLFVKLSTKLIDTPVYDTDGDPIVIPPYAGDDDEFGKDNSEKENKPSLGKEAIIGISVGAVVVVIVVIIVVVVCLCKKDGGSSAGLGRGSMQL